MPDSSYKQIGLASLIMMASVFASRLIGIFRESVLAFVGGTSGGVDAYQIAFILPEILNHVVASGFLSVTFIPIFSHYLADGKAEDGWRVFSVVMTCFGTLLLAMICLCLLLTPRLVVLLAPGLKDPSLFGQAVRMTRIILPAQMFFFAGGLLMAVQFAHQRFWIPALAPLIYNIGIMSGGLLLAPWMGVEGFAWGVLVGALFGNFLVQLWGARSVGLRFRPIFDWRHPDLWRYIRLTLPLMVGLTMTFSTEFLFRFFGSYLPRGGVAVLNFGLRVMLIPVGLFGQAVGVASFPFLARLAARGETTEMNRLLNRTLKYLALVIPVSVLMMVLRYEVVRILFQRGRFDPEDTAATAAVLVYFLIGAFGFTTYTVVVRCYYAAQDTLFPAVYGTVAVVASVPLYLIGLNTYGVRGIALAVSLSGIVQVAVLYGLWSRRTRNAGLREVLSVYARVGLISVPLGLFLHWFKNELLGGIDGSRLGGSLGICAATGAVFVILLLGAGYVFRMPEITAWGGRLASRIRAQR
jgi:putative peptidoglycan lipid II flippase